MVKLIFYTDFNEDIRLYKKWKLREFLGDKVFNYFLSETYPQLVGKTDKEILKYFLNNEDKLIKQTEKAGERLKKSWGEGKKDFFKQIEKITGFKWKHKVYKCHLSSTFICGGCYDAKKGNVVSVFPRLRKEYLLDTLFHELVHLHYWDALDELKVKYNKKEKIVAEGKFWDLSEIAVNHPLQKLRLKGYKAKFNLYPQHKELWRTIKKYWNLPFKEFVLKSIGEIKK